MLYCRVQEKAALFYSSGIDMKSIAGLQNSGMPLFRHTGRAHIRLTEKQAKVRDTLKYKIDSGAYKLEDVKCPCGAGDDVVVAETDRYGLNLNAVICKECGLLRINPVLDNGSMNEFYRREYRDLYMGVDYGDMDNYFFDMVRRGGGILALIKAKAPRTDFQKLAVLEIGCSAGGALIPFLEAGSAVRGFDYDERYIEYGNSRNTGLNLCHGGMETLEREDKQYDLILLNHVLEHLSSPVCAVELIRKRLKTGGMLYLSVPGFKNPAYYHSPTKSFLGSLHIGHLFYFSKLSLTRLLKGFEILYIDDDIRTVCRRKEAHDDSLSLPASEYHANLEFMVKYEKSLAWKAKRLKIILGNFRWFIKLILPVSVVRLITSTHED